MFERSTTKMKKIKSIITEMNQSKNKLKYNLNQNYFKNNLHIITSISNFFFFPIGWGGNSNSQPVS